MKPRRTKKKPLTSPTVEASVSRRVTQAEITSFHTNLKRQARLRSLLVARESDSAAFKQTNLLLAQVDSDIVALGGLEAYQRASKLGQSTERGGDSSRVLIKWLRDVKSKRFNHGDGGQRSTGQMLSMLEIGALTPCNYASCSSWIRNTPIDLNALHPDILEQDFFDRPLPRSDDERFDVISCSLVLNFIADPHDRGRMLFLMHEHLRPTESSLLFLVLPSSCIANSRYISSDSLRKLMAAIGFEFVQESWKVGGKLGYWLWRWAPIIATQDMARWEKKVVQTEGSKRNNFSIVLPKGFLRSR